MAEIAAKKGADVFLVTSDKDMLQVVGERIKVYDPMKDKVLDEEYVRERFGLGLSGSLSSWRSQEMRWTTSRA